MGWSWEGLCLDYKFTYHSFAQPLSLNSSFIIPTSEGCHDHSLPVPLSSVNLGVKQQEANPKLYWCVRTQSHPARLALRMGQIYYWQLDNKPGKSRTGRSGKEWPLRTIWRVGKSSSLSLTPAVPLAKYRTSLSLNILVCKMVTMFLMSGLFLCVVLRIVGIHANML